MKPERFSAGAAVLLAVVLLSAPLLCGCGGKQSGNAPTAGGKGGEHPLPEPRFVAGCEPGIPGGRLVIATLGDPKTFNPITENESSSGDIIRLMFASLTSFHVNTKSSAVSGWPSLHLRFFRRCHVQVH